MGLDCPACSSKLPIGAIRKVFYCPSCKARLAANTMAPVLVATGVWSFSDLLIQSDVYATLGQAWFPGITLRIVLSGIAAWIIAQAAFRALSRIRLAPRPRWRWH